MVGRLCTGGTWGYRGSTARVYIWDEEKEKARRLCSCRPKHAQEILLRGHSMNQGLAQEMEDFLCPFLSPCIRIRRLGCDGRREGANEESQFSCLVLLKSAY